MENIRWKIGDCCPGRPRNLIRLRVNGSDQKATTLVDYVVRKTGVNPIFVWDDETHLTIRANFTQLPGGSLLPPGEILQGVQSALGVTISYPLYSAADFKEALRSGKATAEYVLAASDVAASVYEDRRNPGDAKPSRRFGEPSFGSCEIILEAAHAGPFEKIRLVLGANHDREINEQIKRRNLWLEKGHGPEKGQPEVSGIELPFSGFSIGKLANGDYRKTALTAAFFEGLPPGEQCCFSVSGEEQSFAMTQYVDDDGSMRREWPKRLAGDTLRFRYVFDFDDKSISYVMPLGSVTDQINRFVACVEDR